MTKNKEKPPYKFNIGDWITFSDNHGLSQKGRVVEITWMRGRWTYDIEDSNYRLFKNISEKRCAAFVEPNN